LFFSVQLTSGPTCIAGSPQLVECQSIYDFKHFWERKPAASSTTLQKEEGPCAISRVFDLRLLDCCSWAPPAWETRDADVSFNASAIGQKHGHFEIIMSAPFPFG